MDNEFNESDSSSMIYEELKKLNENMNTQNNRLYNIYSRLSWLTFIGALYLIGLIFGILWFFMLISS